MSSPAWQIFDLKALTARGHQGNVDYQEFLREPTMSCGIYYVKAGSTDMQGYHDEDELYVVIEGRGSLRWLRRSEDGHSSLGLDDVPSTHRRDPFQRTTAALELVN